MNLHEVNEFLGEKVNQLSLKDVMGDPDRLTRQMGGELRALTGQLPQFKKALQKMTGKKKPSHAEIVKALKKKGLDDHVARQYAFWAADKF